MSVDPVTLATTAALDSSRIIEELEQLKQEWPTIPSDPEHCLSLVKLCHNEMQEIADPTNKALLETLREEK